MRAGLGRGDVARVEAVVTDAMTASLGGRPIHPVLATARMIEWMEWAGRRLLLPYLDPDEDAVGYAVAVRHVRPARVGERFWAVARFDHTQGRRVHARVEAWTARGLIGQGRFVQVVLPRRDLARRLQDPGPPP